MMKIVTKKTKVVMPVTKPWLTYDAPRWLRLTEHFILVKVFRQPRYLIDVWTIEEGEPIVAWHPDLEKHLIDDLVGSINKHNE